MIGKQIKVFCDSDISYIENYDKAIADKNNVWDCHHRLETHNVDGSPRDNHITSDELIKLGLYYHRPASELIFLTNVEHRRLHTSKKHFFNNGSIEVFELKCPKGFIPGRLPSNIAKYSEKHKGLKHSKETKEKMSESRKQLKWFTNGEISIFRRECPEGFVPGRIIKNIGLHFYNNGVIEIRARKCPEGFIKGGLPKEKGVNHWYNNGDKQIIAKECPEGFVPGKIR